ncbi:PREDICTED: gamma-aminobutyric acid receptor subunit beta-3-like isoform X5 [Branchiostoma belcheri]|uniref:Gamma-aminobutyric acid receptor subunit beta n=1 Tax=Branchiostoma belcheri TaxID=7741 RepID=A0A6P4ZQF7_BRABE|nr:PREDICTED: gamma-aminobutyric acid receptor subunit beta-3-like isoform X5 [Branchiostoma belcheri]
MSGQGATLFLVVFALFGGISNSVLAQGDEEAANGREEAAETQPVKLTALFKGYDPLIRPNFHGKPVAVQMSMTIASIDQVSEVDMDYTVTVLMRQYWNDPRLKFPGNRSMSLDPRLVKKLWVPDTFLENSKSSYLHAVTVDNALIRLFPDGSILYGMRITAKMECEMDLRKYPMDEQSCPFILESYGYTTEDMTYEWREGDKSISGLKDIRLSQFTIYDYKALQGYGDYETGVTTVLTMTTLVSGTRAQLPKISYIKAIDVYLVVCFVFVFAALLEYAAVNYQSRYYKTPRKSRKSKKAEIEEIQLEEKKAPLAVPENDGSAARNGTTRRRFPSPKVLTSFRSGRKIIEDVNDIDKFSRVLFPVTFAVFNAIYWIVYTV